MSLITDLAVNNMNNPNRPTLAANAHVIRAINFNRLITRLTDGTATDFNVFSFIIGGGTASTNTATGALVVTGGVGISGNLNVGGTITAGSGSTGTGSDAADSVRVGTSSILFEGATADAFETTLSVTDPTIADRVFTIPNVPSFTFVGYNGTSVLINGDGATNATYTSSGAFDTIIDTNEGTDSGTITITDGVDGNITFNPDGTGSVDVAGNVILGGGSTDTITFTGEVAGNIRLLEETDHTLQLNDSITTGTKGGDLTILGASASTTGAATAGGAISIICGPSGVAPGTGGALDVRSGAGQNGAGATVGGASGTATLRTGAPGTSGTGTGGAGGLLSITGVVGGATTGAGGIGGVGSSIDITAGTGGADGEGGSGTGGAGGNIILTPGAGGAGNASGAAGVIDINGGWNAAGQTCTDLGIVTTADINGGTLDGTIIGGAAAAAITGTAIVGTSLNDGTVTLTSGTVTGTWVDLGSVTTIDINGGTIDGAIIGGAVAAAITGTAIIGTSLNDGTVTLTSGTVTGTWVDLGSVTTIDINGGTIDGVTIGGSVAAAITGTAIIGTSLNDGTITLTSGTVTGSWVDLGTVTTVAIVGGTVNNAIIGGSTPAAATFTNITGTGTVTFNGTTTTSGPDAVAITAAIHEVTTTGTGDALSMIDGAEGQRIQIVYVAEAAGGDTAILTPDNLSGASTTVTFNAIGDTANMLFTAGTWFVMGGSAVVA